MKILKDIFIVMASALAVTGCAPHADEHTGEASEMHDDHEGHEDHDHEAEGHDHEHEGHKHGDEITMSPETAKRFGVKVAVLKAGPFSEVIPVSGQIVPASGDQCAVSASASGIFTLSPGMTVGRQISAGTTIGTISAKGIQGGDANSAARAELDAARREYERMKPLLSDGLVTQKDFNEAEARLRAAEAAYSGQSSGGVAVARMGGVITELPVQSGRYVGTGELIAVVSQNSRMTLRADVPEKYYSFLPKITTANFRPDYAETALSLSNMGGQLMSSPSVSGSKGGYIPVYFSFDNRGGVVPGAFAEVYLIGGSHGSVLTVPMTAVVEVQGNHYVYTRVHDDAYAKHLVTLGGTDGVNVEIKSGLKEGDNVVVDGARVVQMAETSNVAPPGHTHNH